MLQVRLNSKRLPGKAVKLIGERTVISYALETLVKVKADKHIILTTQDSVGALQEDVDKYGFEIFVGKEDDVLDRYAKAVKKYNSDIVIRATGDNPYVSAFLANQLLEEFINVKADYAVYKGIPIGTGVEIVKASSLLEADTLATQAFHREHVNPFLYQNPDKYKIHSPSVAASFYSPSLSLTIDTQADFDFVSGLILDPGCGYPAEVDAIIKYCKSRNNCE